MGFVGAQCESVGFSGGSVVLSGAQGAMYMHLSEREREIERERQRETESDTERVKKPRFLVNLLSQVTSCNYNTNRNQMSKILFYKNILNLAHL